MIARDPRTIPPLIPCPWCKGPAMYLPGLRTPIPDSYQAGCYSGTCPIIAKTRWCRTQEEAAQIWNSCAPTAQLGNPQQKGLLKMPANTFVWRVIVQDLTGPVKATRSETVKEIDSVLFYHEDAALDFAAGHVKAALLPNVLPRVDSTGQMSWDCGDRGVILKPEPIMPRKGDTEHVS